MSTWTKISRPFKWFYHEFGIVSIQQTGRNAYLIILARTCRMFAYGTNSLILGMIDPSIPQIYTGTPTSSPQEVCSTLFMWIY